MELVIKELLIESKIAKLVLRDESVLCIDYDGKTIYHSSEVLWHNLQTDNWAQEALLELITLDFIKKEQAYAEVQKYADMYFN